MKKETYNFEIKDLLTQFVAAFDDTVIRRYNKDRTERQKVEVRYVFAPKQRVMYDIVNKAQNITLPVVTVDLNSVSYDSDRVFNKLDKLYNFTNEVDSSNIDMPTPVNLQVSMSILGRYMHDVEQIITNFAPFTNPYIIITWKEPTENEDEDIEIRTEVLWDENISLSTPTETTYSDKFRIIADTSFTIKGWLFRNKHQKSKPIFFIDNNFVAVETDWNLEQALSSLDYENFFESLANSEDGVMHMDTISLSGTPKFDCIYHNYSGKTVDVTYGASPITLNKQALPDLYNYIIVGNNFEHTTSVFLSSDNLSLMDGLTSLDTKYTGPLTAFLLPEESYNILSNNVISINLPYLTESGKIDIIINNPAGWTSSSSISGFYMIAE